ncbi:MAG TPA: glycosyltransferase family 1 protein [Anaerolineae bacterium]|nr:glycosyltransferase family 1 protein [Anaerolineae bacterium]
MRIAMLSYHTCPLATLGGKDTGGMNVYVRELTRELGRHGVGVDVFTRSQDEHIPQVLHDLGYCNRVVHITAGPEIPLAREQLAELLPQFAEGIQAFARAKDLTYDLIHSHYWLSGLVGLQLRRQWQIPMVHMFHTLARMKSRVAQSLEEEPSSLRLEAETEILRSADRVVASTQAELAQFQWLYKVDTDHTAVIPPGVDTAHFYPIPIDEAKAFVGLPPKENLLLYVGRIEPLKGVDVLLEALAILQKNDVLEDHPVRVAIIGGEPEAGEEEMTAEMARLKGICQSLGMGEIVTFLGKQDQESLPYYYSAAEVVVMPSHYESFGMVALEAMACGTPVVASETGGLIFLVRDGETGFHVPAGDAEALADRLQTLIQDEVLRARLGRTAAEYAKGYDWSTITEHIVELYNNMLISRIA